MGQWMLIFVTSNRYMIQRQHQSPPTSSDCAKFCSVDSRLFVSCRDMSYCINWSLISTRSGYPTLVSLSYGFYSVSISLDSLVKRCIFC